MKKKIINLIAILLVVVIIATLIFVVNRYIKTKQVKAAIDEANNAQKNTQVNIQNNNQSQNNVNDEIKFLNINESQDVINETNETNETNEINEIANNTNNEIKQDKNVNNVTTSKAEENTKSTDTTKSKTVSKSTNSTTTTNSSVKGVIFLTFDDGPSANITPKILDILKKENIKATFFVINYSKTNEYLIKRIVNEGHTIGIHGYSHEYSKIYKSKEAYLNNIFTLQEKIKKSTGVTTMYTRFPGGSSNTVSRRYSKGIMTLLSKEMLKRGFKYYDWNVSSGDAGGAKNADAVYKNVIKQLSKKRGNMVLMHDFAANKKGLEALPRIIKYAKQNGYTFAPIDDNTPMYGQHINN